MLGCGIFDTRLSKCEIKVLQAHYLLLLLIYEEELLCRYEALTHPIPHIGLYFRSKCGWRLSKVKIRPIIVDSFKPTTFYGCKYLTISGKIRSTTDMPCEFKGLIASSLQQISSRRWKSIALTGLHPHWGIKMNTSTYLNPFYLAL